MKTRILLLFFAFCSSLLAQTAVTGGVSLNAGTELTTVAPTISSLSQSPDANSVVLGWTTSAASSTSASCGSLTAPYDASQNSVTSHTIAVPQLTPSTAYTCKACSGSTCQTISATTTASPATTPITGISLGTFTQYNSTSPPYTMTGDTFWNTVSNDSTTYITTGDSTGFNGGASCAYSTVVGKFTSNSPIVIANVNVFSGWPGCTLETYMPTLEYPHDTGIMSIGGNLLMSISYATQALSNPIIYWYYNSIFMSQDHGLTWNTQTFRKTFNAVPIENNPQTTRMWPNGPPYFDDSQFVLQGADDGTLGYATTANRVLNANSYIYGMSNAQNSTGLAISQGDSYYLWRVPRSQITDLNPAEYQFYTGGDGTQAAAWSNTQTSATAVLTDDCNATNLPSYPGCLGPPSINYIPALNRYLLLAAYWPTGQNNGSNTTLLAFESPTPWGTWTLVSTIGYPTTGYYEHAVLQADALAAGTSPTTMKVVFASNYQSTYTLYYATMTVSH